VEGKMSLFFRILVAGVCLAATLASGAAKAIVGGQLDGSLHPSVGFLLGLDAQGRPFYSCSGTLVAPRLFVTAAHCTGGLQGLVPSEVRVVFDSKVSLPSPSLYVTGHPYPNPRFSAQLDAAPTLAQRSEDYGVVVLEQSANEVFPSVTTSPLATEDLVKKAINKQSFTLVGFGVSWLGKLKSLTFDGYRRYAIADANGAALLDPSVLDVKANPNGLDPTDGLAGGGDSGGPVFTEDGTLVGVISGIDAGGKTLAARVDTPNAKQFLSQF
jgi:hypothetical protein